MRVLPGGAVIGLAGIVLVLAPLGDAGPSPRSTTEISLGPRSAATEARVRAALDSAFEVSPGVSAPYTLACDQKRCSLQVDETRLDPAGWTARFHDNLSLASIVGTGVVLGPGSAYFDVAAPGVSGGYRWMESVTSAFDSSQAIADCKRRFLERGHVTFKLEPNLASRSTAVVIQGTLADAPIAACVADVVANLLEAHPMPDEMTYVWSEIRLTDAR